MFVNTSHRFAAPSPLPQTTALPFLSTTVVDTSFACVEQDEDGMETLTPCLLRSESGIKDDAERRNGDACAKVVNTEGEGEGEGSRVRRGWELGGGGGGVGGEQEGDNESAIHVLIIPTLSFAILLRSPSNCGKHPHSC